jgi:hypothetical protein
MCKVRCRGVHTMGSRGIVGGRRVQLARKRHQLVGHVSQRSWRGRIVPSLAASREAGAAQVQLQLVGGPERGFQNR